MQSPMQSPVQMTYKEFRQLAQGTQSMVTSVAILAALGMAWYALKRYLDAREETLEAKAEDWAED